MKHIAEWAQTMIGQSVEDMPMEAVIDLHGYLNHLAAAILKDEQEGGAAKNTRAEPGKLWDVAGTGDAEDYELTEYKPEPAEPADAEPWDDFPDEAWKEWWYRDGERHKNGAYATSLGSALWAWARHSEEALALNARVKGLMLRLRRLEESEVALRADLAAAQARVKELEKQVPLYKCSVCKTEADPGCFPDPKNPSLVMCEPCMEVATLKALIVELDKSR